MSTEPKKRPTIAELEAILNTNENKTVEVLPDGSIIVDDELTSLRLQLSRALEEAERAKGEPFKCPVCSGRGNVPAGFYGYIGSNVAPEPCKSCGGQGVIFTARADASRANPAAAGEK